jgi:hypothetical protein
MMLSESSDSFQNSASPESGVRSRASSISSDFVLPTDMIPPRSEEEEVP